MKTLEQLKELASKCLDGRDFKSAHWWDYQDCYITISHCDCDDNSLFSDRIKNSIEPELWISLDVITNYLPDIKQRMTLMYIGYMKQECIIFIRIDFKKI